MPKKLVLALSALSLSVLAACGGGSDDSFNDADVTFAQQMIPHHEQAIAMATLAESNGESAEVKDLAQRIQRAQAPEIATMRAWLAEWGKEEDAGMDHGGMDMDGMMSDDEMAAFEAAAGPDFDRMFIEMMIRHHQGAIEMSNVVIDKGKADAVQQLAGEIITAQQAEISEMKGLQPAAA